MIDEAVLLHASGLSKQFPTDAASKRKYLLGQFRAALGLNTNIDSSKHLHALTDVSLRLSRGQSLGIIGPNGAGKSTLLKLIQGSLSPDSGTLATYGSVGGLIELTSGFQESLSGNDNISIKSRQLSLDDGDIEQLKELIIEFSGLGSRVEDPINTYSTGMKARLGFAIATHLPYDIMICDEALSVGDAMFQQKCLRKVTELKRDRVFILVSHSMSHIRRFCDEVLVLWEGKPLFLGGASEGIEHYENLTETEDTPVKPEIPNRTSVFDPIILDTDKVSAWHSNLNFEQSTRVLSVNLHLDLREIVDAKTKFVVGIPIFNDSGEMVTGFSDESLNLDHSATSTEFDLSFRIPKLNLNPGKYTVIAALQIGLDKFFRQIVGHFEIRPGAKPYWGVFTPESELEISLKPSFE